MKNLELNEKSLELIVSDKSLGHLTTNAIQIKELVKSILPKYDIANYDESNIDQAKKDKALLNNSAKMLNDERIKIEKEWMKPFDEFKGIVTETVGLIKQCVVQIDSVVKESDSKAKAEKNKKIEEYWDSLDFNLVLLSKIFEERWLNKTVSLKKVQEEISLKIEKIKADLLTLEASFPEDSDQLKAIFLEHLDLGEAMRQANILKENRRKLEEAKKPKDAEEPVFTFRNPVETDEVSEEEENPIWDTPRFENAITETEVQQEEAAEILTRFMKVVGTRDHIIALGNWMNNNGIHFEKLENVTA